MRDEQELGIAISNETPCLRMFDSALAGCHSKRIAIVELRIWRTGGVKLQPRPGAERNRQDERRRLVRIIDLPFEQPVRSISNIAEALGVTYSGAGNNVAELVRQGMAEELRTYPKLIRFRGGGGFAGGVSVLTSAFAEDASCSWNGGG